MNRFHVMLSDDMVIRRVLSGKRHFFEVLVHRYLPGVYAVAYAQTRNHADAEDIAQEAFLKAFMALDTLRERRRFEGWVVTIARNMAHKLWQQRQREARLAEQLGDMPEPAAEDAARRELQALLRQRIEQLPEEQREILLLHYFGGKSTREMAALLEISRDAVKKRLQRARETLSANLLDTLGDACTPPDALIKRRTLIMGAVAAALPNWGRSAATALAQGGVLSGLFPTLFSPAAPLVAGACVCALILAAALTASRDGKINAPTEAVALSSEGETYAVSVDEMAQLQGENSDAALAQDVGSESVAAEIAADHVDTTVTEKKTAPSDIESRLLLPVSIEFENIHISRVLEFISDSFDVNVIVDQRVLAIPTMSEARRWEHLCYTPVMDTTVETYDTSETRLEDALTSLCMPFGLAYVVIPSYWEHAYYIWISTPEEIARNPFPVGPERYEGRDLEAILDMIIPPLEFHDVALVEILNSIGDALELNIVGDHRYIGHGCLRSGAVVNVPLDEILRQSTTHNTRATGGRDRIIDTGMVHYIKMENATLRDALECLLRPLGLSYSIEDGFVWVTSPELLQRESFRPAPRHFEAQLSQTYRGLLPSAHTHQDLSLSKLLAALEETSKTPFHVDTRVISAESPRIYDLYYHQMLPAYSLLNVATRLCDLGYVVLPNRIVISTPDRLLRSEFPEEYFVPVGALFAAEGSLQHALSLEEGV